MPFNSQKNLISLTRALSLVFNRDKRAVSAVVSNVILTGAVIMVGFSVLSWMLSQSSISRMQYSEAVNADIDRLKERLGFEYVFYNGTSKSLLVYLINCGTVDNVNLTTVYISFANGTEIKAYSYSGFALKSFSGMIIADHKLNRGDEGYVVLSSLNFDSGNYLIRVATKRGSSFDYAFAV